MPRPKGSSSKKGQQPIARSSETSLRDSELAHMRTCYSVEELHAQESQRKLRAQLEIHKGEAEDARLEASAEKEAKEEAKSNAEGWRQRCNDTLVELEQMRMKLDARNRESESLRAEVEASQANHDNASKLLSEKLSLSREISNLKPELEHLRSQAAANSSLLSDKLFLQGQLNDTQEELTEKSHQLIRSQRQEAKLEKQVEAAERALDKLKVESNEVCEARLKAEKERDQAMASNARVAQTAKDEDLETLRANVAQERKEREKLEKNHIQEYQGWEAERAVLDDKLTQFRNKLRSTKEKLRATESELEVTRADAARQSAPTVRDANPRKRKVSDAVDLDAALGTPGNGDTNRRAKRASSLVGEKSTFSITPFLNRTASVQPEGADEPIASIEDRSPSTRPATNVLVASGAGKSNQKMRLDPSVRKRSVAAATTLEQVNEEEDSNDENRVPGPMVNGEKQGAHEAKPAKPALKPRKSLANFASFREGSLQPRSRLGSVEPVTKKKRKLLGNAGGKTLMDNDEDESATGESVGAFGGKTLFGGGMQRTFGAFGNTAGGFGGGPISKRKGPLKTADGFAFSPLKKERRAMAAASRAASEVPAA